MEEGNGTCMIAFECSCETLEDEHLLIVGSAREFGDWDVAQGLPLTTAPDIYPTWRTASVRLDSVPAGEDIEYKYVKVGPMDAIWEKGDNRVLQLGDCQGDPDDEHVVKDGHFYLGRGRRSSIVRSVSEISGLPSSPSNRNRDLSPDVSYRLEAAQLAAQNAAEEASEQAARLAAQQLEQQLEIQRLESELAAMREAKVAAEQAARQATEQAEEQAHIQKLEAELSMMRDAKAAQQAAQVAAQKAADHAVKTAEQQKQQQAQQQAEIQKLEGELTNMREAKAESHRLKNALEKEKRERERSRTRHTTHTKHLERMIERSKSHQRWSDTDAASGEGSPKSRMGSEGFPSPSAESPKPAPMLGTPTKPAQLESKVPVLPKLVHSEADEKHDGPHWPTGIKDSLTEAVTTARTIEEALTKATAAEAVAIQELRYAQLRALSMDLGEIEAVVAKQGPPNDGLGETTVVTVLKHQQEAAQAQAICEQRRAELEREVTMLRLQVSQHVPKLKGGKKRPRTAGIFVLILFLGVLVALARNPTKARFGVADVEDMLDQATEGIIALRGQVRNNMARYELNNAAASGR